MSTVRFQPMNLGRWLLWSAYALILLAAPLVFSKGGGLTLLSQMGTVMIFGLSYNMLLGQGGMLSFGHAVYSGLGAFFAIHAMNLAGAGQAPIPTSMIPLVGGLAGMAFGVLFGYVTTRRAGTTFAMITLGLVELVFASSLMFPDFFGGEGGVTTNRVIGDKILGISYGPQIQVYYLIAFWLFVCTVTVYAYTHTPLGRIINAVRDNPERVEFIGYDTQWVRYLVLILSSFFAGVSGGLSAINFEIVSAENVSAIRSGSILLFTFIGGIGFFFGPLLGAIVGILFSVLLSDYTPAWQLYLGLFFVLLVRYAPGGLGSLLMLLLRTAKFGQFGRVAGPLGWVCLAALPAVLGLVLCVEMLYHLTMEAANGSVKNLFGVAADTRHAMPWLVAGGLMLAGVLGWRRAQPAFAEAWNDASAVIAAKIRSAS
ncbi:branched-chain amino acid ABC transporter permease [Pseudoduganella namucuonensis]|uniref:Amino acid/amide ABC transporter membrane protein 2, HAAT family n=1 Tax=Pseudoduganella namucuonensis TaxID=1035707 RepID=A0A1I7HCE1_9BURK|nr:branched-chain amino acid ABC transporter permease [Pseudoduganella namucuonensis]SFU58390.1 amino acid/amide ABC transporter membrane protein 2, HAAT family [Pseudoduganella namucuonensis]